MAATPGKKARTSRSPRLDKSGDQSLVLAEDVHTGELVIATTVVVCTAAEQDRRRDAEATIAKIQSGLDKEERDKTSGGFATLVPAEGQTGFAETPQECASSADPFPLSLALFSLPSLTQSPLPLLLPLFFSAAETR